MSNPTDTEHGALPVTAGELLDALESLPRLVDTADDVLWLPHREFAERGQRLGQLLRTAVSLVSASCYAAAFALLRPALERALFDRLLFLGRQYDTHITTRPTDDEWTEWERWAREEGRNVLDMRRTTHGARISLQRIAVTGDGTVPGQALSAYVHLLDSYDPMLGPAAEQSLLAGSFEEDVAKAERAKRNREMYQYFFEWRSIVEGLVANKLLSAAERLQVSVHYRFLSAFVHPYTDQGRLLTGSTDPALVFDHYSSELGLLYVITLGAYEIESVLRVLELPPAKVIEHRERLLNVIANARAQTDYFWFLSGKPHAYDRWHEANARGPLGSRPAAGDRPQPEDLADDEVRYYPNPLRRLTEMHHSKNELSGFLYVSPWPREDHRW